MSPQEEEEKVSGGGGGGGGGVYLESYIADNPPSSRCAELERLHRSKSVDAISRTHEGDRGHSILQQDMPDDEDYDCEPSWWRRTASLPTLARS